MRSTRTRTDRQMTGVLPGGRDEALLCRELLSRMRDYPAPGGLRFDGLRGRRLALKTRELPRSRSLRLSADSLRDWFIARYTHDLQQMQEIEQDILAELYAEAGDSGRVLLHLEVHAG